MKKLVKWIFLILFYVIVIPFGFSARLARMILDSDFLFHMWGQCFSLIPDPPGNFARRTYYKQTLKEFHLDVAVGFGTIFTKMDSTVAHRAEIGGFCLIGLVDIEELAIIASRTSVLSGRRQHDFNAVSEDNRILDDSTFDRTRVGGGSFIGEKCLIMADVGKGTVIGAGSVVVKAIPDNVIAVGNPAKVIRELEHKS